MGHNQDLSTGGLLDPATLPVSSLRIVAEPVQPLSDSDRHVLEFIRLRLGAGNQALLNELLAMPGPSRNALLGSVLSLEFVGTIRIFPKWTTEEFVAARDKGADRRRDDAHRAAVAETASQLLGLVARGAWNPVGDAVAAVLAAAEAGDYDFELPGGFQLPVRPEGDDD